MNGILASHWLVVGDMTVPRLVAQESAALIVLAASLLVFRTFRERYLLIWILGWLAYFISRWTVHGSLESDSLPRYLTAISHAEFILAVCLFAAAVFVYTNARDFLLPLLLTSIAVIAYAAARALLWPDSVTLRVALEIAYRLIALTASLQLIRFRWARWEIGAWLLSLTVLLQPMKLAPITAHLPPGFSLMGSMMLGLSMLLVVFDDYKLRTRRLGVVNALTTTITRAQQHGPMMATALEELKRLMHASAAWIRLLEGDRTVIAQQIGLSQEYLRERNAVKLDDNLEQLLGEGTTKVMKTSAATEDIQPCLKAERFHHVVLVPLLGKKSAIGILVLGSRHRLSYTPDEIEFLTTSAHQLGLAIENLRLVEQILRSQRQWANTFDSIHDFVLVHDAEFRVVKANRAILQRLERAPADVVGNLCEAVLPRNYGQWSGCPYCHGSDEGFYEGTDPCFGGFSMISTSSYMEQGSKQKGTIHVVRDTTDRRIAEEKYRLLFEQVQEGVFVATPEGKLLDCNDAFLRMLGYTSREELMALNVDAELYASREQREVFRREVELHNYVRNFEVTLRRKDGALLSAMESSFATRNAEGKIERYQCFLLDITEKRRAERVWFSEVTFTDAFGDWVTRSRTEVLTAEYLPHLPPLVAEFIRADGLLSWIWVLLWDKDGPMGIMGISSRETREYTSNDENLLVAIGRQLSTTIEKVRLYEETCRAYEDLRHTQEQLLQSEKMSAIGQLIAGVAHELNNPLTAILGYAQLLESEGLGERAADFVGKLFKQAQRTHRVVQNLLSFARQRKPEKQQVDVRKVLQETLALRDYDLRVNNIKLEQQVDPDLPAVTADPHQLEQVFLNIINNAVDAMLEAGKGGSLKVRMSAKDGDVLAEFQDSGPGIKEPGKIFDPFYTTKDVGKGTGLGLSICYGIVKEHGGDITARNCPDGGAIVKVRFPSSDRVAAPEIAAPLPPREFAIEGRILLAEDEAAVLEFERDVLTGAGAQVVTLMNAEDVRTRLLTESFDAVIVNGKLPGGWSAPEVYGWISGKCPGLEKRLLFTFSSDAEPEVRDFLAQNNLPHLVKPFEVADLIAQARRLLQKTHAVAAS